MSLRASPKTSASASSNGSGARSSSGAALKSTIHGFGSAPESAAKPVRAATELPADPFHLTPYAQELVARRVMLAPVLVTWQYNVASRKRFAGWLGTREILMCDVRLGADSELRDVRYCGTYRTGTGVAEDGRDAGGTYRTMWGYTTEAAMHTVQRLAINPNGPTTIIQNDLIDFIATIKRFVAEAGDRHFSQEVLMGAAAG
jgi:PII-like signaling protein